MKIDSANFLRVLLLFSWVSGPPKRIGFGPVRLATMALLLRLCYLLSLVAIVSAKGLRDRRFLNSTTSVTEDLNIHAPDKTKFKPHLEVSETGFLPEVTTSVERDVRATNLGVATLPVILRTETTVSGFTEENSAGPRPTGFVSTTTNPDELRPRPETTASGFEVSDPVPGAITRIATPPVVRNPVTVDSRVLLPTRATNIQIGDQTLTPGGETVTIGTGPSATQIHINANGQPVIVVSSLTSTYHATVTIGDQMATPVPSGLVVDGQTVTKGGPPIVVGSTTLSINDAGETIAVSAGTTSTVRSPATNTLTFGEVTATAVVVNNQYVVGSSTLAPGKPTTIDGTVMVLTTNAAGSTVLVAGTVTTTLPAPSPTSALAITTTVISGTTQYIINSQTLFPGHPINLDGTPMSIIITAGTTILIVGEKTTTISPPYATPASGPTTIIAAATPIVSSTSPGPTSTSAISGADDCIKPCFMVTIGTAAIIFAIMSFG